MIDNVTMATALEAIAFVLRHTPQRQSPNPEPPTDGRHVDVRWIAWHAGRSIHTVRNRIVRAEDFPAPVVNDTPQSRRWLREDVVRYFSERRR